MPVEADGMPFSAGLAAFSALSYEFSVSVLARYPREATPLLLLYTGSQPPSSYFSSNTSLSCSTKHPFFSTSKST